MKLKKVLIALCCISLVLGSLLCKKDSGTIKIGAIFAISGRASFLGKPESRTAQMLVDKINAEGGINGKKIELIIKDSAGSPSKTVSFAKQLIEEEKVIAIIGPSRSGSTMQIKNLVEKSKTILISCAAAEVIVNPVARYVFKTPQKDSHAVMKIFETMKKMNISKIGVIYGTTGFGKAGNAQLKKIAPKYNIKILISESYTPKATDLTGQLAKLKAKGVEAVVNWSIVPAQSIAAKNMKQIKMNVPLFQSHGFGNVKFAKAAGKAGDGIIFPAGKLLIADLLPDGDKQKSLLVRYKKDYESKYKEDVSTFGGHAYDAMIILVEALKKAGTDKQKLREAIENLKGVVGTAGIFNFSPEDHNGLGLDSFTMITVKDMKFVPYKGN